MFMIVEVMLWLCIRCKRIFEGVLMFTYSSHKSEFGGLFGFSTHLHVHASSCYSAWKLKVTKTGHHNCVYIGLCNSSNHSVLYNQTFLICLIPRLVVHLLEVVDGCFSTFLSQEEAPRQSALDAATSLMTSAMPSSVQHQAQALLATLHPSKMSYHSHKVIFTLLLSALNLTCKINYCELSWKNQLSWVCSILL